MKSIARPLFKMLNETKLHKQVNIPVSELQEALGFDKVSYKDYIASIKYSFQLLFKRKISLIALIKLWRKLKEPKRCRQLLLRLTVSKFQKHTDIFETIEMNQNKVHFQMSEKYISFIKNSKG